MVFFFQAEDGIRDLVRSRGLGDVYKRQNWGYSPKYSFKNEVEIDGKVLKIEMLVEKGRIEKLSLIHI